jgi:hypothetical protein
MSELALIDKAQVLALLKEQLQRELTIAAESQQRTQTAATHEESRPENDKDTRALESSYLARGQAGRVAELAAAVTSLAALSLRPFAADTPIALSALIELDDGQRQNLYFMAPAGGGQPVEVAGRTLLVLTPKAPLGRALIGRRIGDSIEVRTPQGLREYEIVSVA